MAKVNGRVIYPLLFLTFLNALDRVNVSFAALQMNKALGFTPEVYGFGVGLFFITYLLFQMPSLWILKRVGARRWIAGSMIGWGLVASLMAFVNGAPMFYALRLALGVAEAGFAPGVIFYVSQFTAQRRRAGAVAATMLAIPASVILGAPLGGWLMTQVNPIDMPGWRWMFLVEGLPSIMLGLVALRFFSDGPADASWLSDEERAALARRREADLAGRPHGTTSIWPLLASVRVWAAIGVWFCTLAGAYGLIFWLPLVIKAMTSHGDFKTSLLAATPWLGVGAGMALNAWHSDRSQERFWHVGLGCLLGAAGIGLAAATPNHALALALLILGGLGLGGAQGAFWAIPTRFLPPAALAVGIGLINMLGSLGGIVGSNLIGYLRAHSASYQTPVFVLAGFLACGALFLLPIAWAERRRDSRDTTAV